MAKKKSKKKLYIILGIILVLILALVFSFGLKKGNGAIEVTVAKAEKRNITQTVTAVGKIEAETEVKISSETSGEIIDLPYKEGDYVKKGTLLARIKPDIIESQLNQVKAASEASKSEIEGRKAALENAQKEYDRIMKLFEKKHVSQSEVDQAKSALDQATSALVTSKAGYNQSLASLEQVQKNKNRTVLFAPIDGTMTKLNVLNGEKVVGTAMMQGTEMMRISDLTDMNAIVEVNENEIVRVKLGDTAIVEIDAFPDRTFMGLVREVGHSAITSNTGSQDQEINFKVKVRILDPEQRMRPGMSCNVEIKTETKFNVISIPKQSVTVRDEKKGMTTATTADDKAQKFIAEDKDAKKKKEKASSVVFVKDGDKVKLVKVKYGINDKDYIEIIEGISEGDEVISGTFQAISKLLEDGSIIKIDTLDRSKLVKKK